MSLLIKSQENKKAFLLLKEHQQADNRYEEVDGQNNVCFRAPAIHCCYYSCFQRLLFILKEYFTEHFEEDPKIGHGTQIKTFLNCIGGLVQRTSYFELDTALKELKNLRNTVDYKDDLPTSSQLSKAEDYMIRFHSILKRELPHE